MRISLRYFSPRSHWHCCLSMPVKRDNLHMNSWQKTDSTAWPLHWEAIHIGKELDNHPKDRSAMDKTGNSNHGKKYKYHLLKVGTKLQPENWSSKQNNYLKCPEMQGTIFCILSNSYLSLYKIIILPAWGRQGQHCFLSCSYGNTKQLLWNVTVESQQMLLSIMSILKVMTVLYHLLCILLIILHNFLWGQG